MILSLLLIVGFGVFLYYEDTLFPQDVPHEEAALEDTVPEEDGMVDFCIQVITPARNPETGEIHEFPTPCDVPDGWEEIEPEGLELDLQVQ